MKKLAKIVEIEKFFLRDCFLLVHRVDIKQIFANFSTIIQLHAWFTKQCVFKRMPGWLVGV